MPLPQESSISTAESMFDLASCIVQQAGLVANRWMKDQVVTSGEMDALAELMEMWWEAKK